MTPYKVERHRHTPEIEQELAVLGATLPITFTPHLVPLAQGELVSAYVTPAIELSEADLAELYHEAYEGEPWVEVKLGPPGVLEVRETNYCRISVHRDDRTGRVLVFSAIDNLWKGAASQAVQNLNLMFGRDESEGLDDEPLGSSLPEHAVDAPGGLPQGFRASRRGRRASSRAAAPTSACSSPTRPARSARRASRAPACSPRR